MLLETRRRVPSAPAPPQSDTAELTVKGPQALIEVLPARLTQRGPRRDTPAMGMDDGVTTSASAPAWAVSLTYVPIGNRAT